MNLNLDWKELNEIDISGQFELLVNVEDVQYSIIKNKGDFFEVNQDFPDYDRFEGICEQMNDGFVNLNIMEGRCLDLFDVSMKQFKLEVLSFIAEEFYHLKINEVDDLCLETLINKAELLNKKIDKYGDRIEWELFMERINKLAFYYENVIGKKEYDQELRIKEVHFNNHLKKDINGQLK